MKNSLLFTLLVVPGALAVGLSGYWAFWDYSALVRADSQVQELARTGSDRELAMAIHRNEVHRANVAAEGTWLLLGAILAGIGIHGMVVRSKG